MKRFALVVLILTGCEPSIPTRDVIWLPQQDMATSCPDMDLLRDPRNCGSCGNVCSTVRAAICIQGRCV